MKNLATSVMVTFLSTSLLVSSRRGGGGGGGGVVLAFSKTNHRRVAIRCLSTTALHAKGKAAPAKEKNAYAETILLPDTPFSQRAMAAKREPELQAFWKDTDLYQKCSQQAAAQPRFVLHDGPPYANGDLHCGHALNKILKDFINRQQVLNGKQVHYVPGWDCHGLPIELKVLQTIKSKERAALTPVQLRQKAATFAQETVVRQSTGFQRLGVYGDFENPYLTMQPAFEAAQIRVFGNMFQRGYIFRGRKPVHWSPSSQTALAEAELEYPAGHVSKSIYVALPIQEPSAALQKHVNLDDDDDNDNRLRFAIWTTTPWTMPANMAVAVNADLEYSIVQHDTTGKLVVATDLVQRLAETLQLLPKSDKGFDVLDTVLGADLVGSTYKHPLYNRISPVVAGGDYITTESGTGLVHTAPGHGQEDYQTGLKYGLDLLSPVDNVGKFTQEAGEQFAGLSVLGEGNIAVMDALNATGALLRVEDYQHKYPYDWRTKKPTIFRATDQWFASVEGFRADTLEAIETVRWVPDIGKNRIKSFVDNRGDWCISRQRSWGVPIPVFYDKESGKEVLLNSDTLDHIEKLFLEHGSDCWWTMDETELLPEKYKEEADKWQKGTDTMDVWFDSGSSWAGVAQSREELAYPADVYLEGSDQHRGWFQSSLLTSVANNKQAPYKTVLTHGFVLDEKGFKMSKSLGNVVDPMKVIEGGNNQKKEPAYGADVLRLWVANSDYSGDICIGDSIIKQTFEIYRKLRNTARYLLGNLADFVPAGQPNSNAVPYDELPSLDKYMLGRLSTVLKNVKNAMDDYQFQRAVQEIARFASTDLSNFYLDVAKDRLYISGVDEKRRRSCQTVLHACIEGFAKAISPVLPHMAEDIWQNIPYDITGESVFLGGYPEGIMDYTETDDELWSLVRTVRDDVNKVLDSARSDKLVGASLEAAAFIYIPDEEKKTALKQLVGDENLVYPPEKTNGVDELRTVLMLSQVHIVDSESALKDTCDEKYTMSSEMIPGAIVGVAKASGEKCQRCWFYDNQVNKHGLPHADICARCNEAIISWEKNTGATFSKPAPETAEQPVA